MFTPETIAFIKERIDSQVPPIVHHLAEIATSQNTRRQIGALIKREVDEYYEQLSLIKKIFISRERIHREVDELVNKTLPRRIEKYLRGPAFEQEAESFLNSTIDKVLATAQVTRMFFAPIGRVGHHLPKAPVRRATETLVERITQAASERFPAAIAEFDVEGIVLNKVAAYPLEKLEELIISVAGHH